MVVPYHQTASPPPSFHCTDPLPKSNLFVSTAQCWFCRVSGICAKASCGDMLLIDRDAENEHIDIHTAIIQGASGLRAKHGNGQTMITLCIQVLSKVPKPQRAQTISFILHFLLSTVPVDSGIKAYGILAILRVLNFTRTPTLRMQEGSERQLESLQTLHQLLACNVRP